MLSRRILPLAVLITLAACSSSPTSDGGQTGTGNGAITGKVNNVTWANASTGLTYTASSHTYAMSATTIGSNLMAMSLVLNNIQAAGTYALGPGTTFRYSNVSIGGLVWETPVTGSSAGQVVIDIATATRLKGHLTYTGSPASSSPGATGTVTVDLTFDATVTSSN